jgi:hypothetical protein
MYEALRAHKLLGYASPVVFAGDGGIACAAQVVVLGGKAREVYFGRVP